ncbi:MAG: peptidase domain-containing ABC transporter [Bacteroidales bacterium]
MLRGRIKIKQQGRYDCGAACLASVAANYGVYIPVSRIRLLSGTDTNGSTIRGLTEAAVKLGFEAEGFRGKPESLERIPKPAIMHLRKEDGYLHFVVLYKYLKSHILIMDPAEGDLEKITTGKFLSEWSGYLMLVLPGKTLKKSDNYPVFRFMRTLTEENLRPLIASISLSALCIISSISVVIFIKHLIDNVIPAGESDGSHKLIFALIVIMGLSVILSVVKAFMSVKMSVGIDRHLTSKYIKQLFAIPLPFFNSFKTGEITSRISDIYKIRRVLSELIPESVIALFTLFVSVIILIIFEPELAVMCMLFIPAYFAVFILHDRINKRVTREIAESASGFQSYLFESIKSVATIKNFCYEDVVSCRAEKRLDLLSENIKRSGIRAVAAGGAVETLSKSMMVFVLGFGGAGVISGDITTGELVSFYTLTSLFTSPVQQLASLIPALREGSVSARRYLDIVLLDNEERDTASNPDDRLKKLEVKDISFSFPGRDTLFSNISFSLNAGEILKIKGESGCGKSTLAAILMMHHKSFNGSILADGVDLTDLNAGFWRSRISIVPQEPDLIGESILECMTGSNPTPVKISETEQLCREMRLEKVFNALPNGILTHPGECGSMLSRGEKQRIAFARAVLRRPSLLILDEATSSLDPESAGIIEKMILSMKASGIMILMISHNENSSVPADKTLLIEKRY